MSRVTTLEPLVTLGTALRLVRMRSLPLLGVRISTEFGLLDLFRLGAVRRLPKPARRGWGVYRCEYQDAGPVVYVVTMPQRYAARLRRHYGITRR